MQYTLAPPDPLTPLIEKYFFIRQSSAERAISEAMSVVPPHRAIGRFSPSSMGHCHRKDAFAYMGVRGKKPKLTTEQELIFEIGTWTHRMWQMFFRDMEKVLGSNVFRVIAIEGFCKVDQFHIAGRCDVHASIKGMPYIIDIKTIRDSGFQEIMTSSTPYKDHVEQLTRYMYARKIVYGILLYLNKNDQRYKIFQVNFDKTIWTASAKWANTTLNYLRQEMLPPRSEECSPDNAMGKNCAWCTLCWEKQRKTQIRKLYEGKPTADEIWETIGSKE